MDTKQTTPNNVSALAAQELFTQETQLDAATSSHETQPEGLSRG
ncbi:hypothetical protein [Legionella rowbothamii]|nr:hypothetical protein [Legionella rowbothamii]